MKHFCEIALVVAGVTVCSIFVHAAGMSPYTKIPERNIFGLVPLEIEAPPPAPEAPPPKITLNGTMTIFGRPQALFKVAQRSSTRVWEDHLVLAESEGEDDIKVIRIDPMNETVTFDNHGTVQQIPLISRK